MCKKAEKEGCPFETYLKPGVVHSGHIRREINNCRKKENPNDAPCRDIKVEFNSD